IGLSTRTPVMRLAIWMLRGKTSTLLLGLFARHRATVASAPPGLAPETFCFHAKAEAADQLTGLAGAVAGRVAPPRTYSRMLTISVQIAIARKPKNPTGVTATMPIRIAIQPSHAGSTG